jgi:hypothetical protein
LVTVPVMVPAEAAAAASRKKQKSLSGLNRGILDMAN